MTCEISDKIFILTENTNKKIRIDIDTLKLLNMK